MTKKKQNIAETATTKPNKHTEIVHAKNAARILCDKKNIKWLSGGGLEIFLRISDWSGVSG